MHKVPAARCHIYGSDVCGSWLLCHECRSDRYITPVTCVLRAQTSTEPTGMNKTSVSSSLRVPFGSSLFWFIPKLQYHPLLSCIIFRVLGLILRFLIHFELIFVQGERYGSSFSFLHADTQFSQKQLMKRLSFFCGMFLAHLPKIRWV
jgi:hypothetical protein